jgi:hypothetical protein
VKTSAYVIKHFAIATDLHEMTESIDNLFLVASSNLNLLKNEKNNKLDDILLTG